MQNTTKTAKTEKNVRAVRCSVYTLVAYKGIALLCKRKPKTKSHSHSLVTIYDLSMDERAIGDLPDERLGIECLPTSSATMTKKRTKSVLRSTFSKLGLCFSSWSSYFLDFSVGSTLLFKEAQQRFCSCCPLFSTSVPIEDLDRYSSL